MKKLVKDVVDEQRSTISERDQKCTLKLPKNEISAKVDGQYIRIAVENLLTNATKYTRRGGRIRVELTSTRQKVSIKVRDNGVGVDEKDKDMLFKKFSRIQNELTSDVVGSGIGLYLTKQILDSHNGSIIFESTPNKGSQVTLIIPRKPLQTLERISQLSIRP
ncbi:MAG: ATP-binding protein [Candidatus Saccharimonadales bacterium]